MGAGMGLRGRAIAVILGCALVGVAPLGAGPLNHDAAAAGAQSIGASNVVEGRFVTTVSLDGGALTVSPAPAQVVPGRWNEHSVASVLWATWQLRGPPRQSWLAKE